MKKNDFGDLFLKRTKKLGGFEIWVKPEPDETKNKKLCHFNELGMKKLANWITNNLEKKEKERKKQHFWDGNPEGKEGITKVVGFNQGFRGKVIAVNKKQFEAIWLGMNGETHGKLYKVKQVSSDQWMEIIKQVTKIPNVKEWKIL